MPRQFFIKGTLLAKDDLAIAVVGARYATVYGRQVTEKLVWDLVSDGLTIVSGLAIIVFSMGDSRSFRKI
ncbi:MAG: DNA-protecting protein DprA [Candidatus Curtissbacteria bacterium]|nr:DNA-protecting protein DprA [Candidatus Curtissbacteria bacterium]